MLVCRVKTLLPVALLHLDVLFIAEECEPELEAEHRRDLHITSPLSCC